MVVAPDAECQAFLVLGDMEKKNWLRHFVSTPGMVEPIIVQPAAKGEYSGGLYFMRQNTSCNALFRRGEFHSGWLGRFHCQPHDKITAFQMRREAVAEVCPAGDYRDENPGLVKEVMGHESLTTTMGYLHPERHRSKSSSIG
jgi:hypothetical protein